MNRINRAVKLRFLMHSIIIIALAVVIINITGVISQYSSLQKAVQFNETEMERFRSMDISQDALTKLYEHTEDMETDFIHVLTINMLIHRFHISDDSILYYNPDSITGISAIYESSVYQEMYQRYSAVFEDARFFPIPNDYKGETISFSDSWNSPRTYGGNRRHEGTDIMTSNNVRGYFPIVSITDGIVEKLGWLEKGGYRIGIRSKSGGYFYYAHLYEYLPGLKVGDKVIAGDIIGFMGDSGYGKKEGTIGQFDVHLHLGIYIDESDGEMSVNPFALLKFLENKRQNFIF